MKPWFALVFFLIPTYLIAQDKSESELKVEKAVVYGKGGDKNLELNIAVPPGKGPFPAVILIHGGSWKSGSYKDKLMTMLLEKIAKAGYVTASIQYRLTPSGARFPSQIEDCKCAVRWMRGNAEKYQIDPKRIGALGGSAGAHLALLLGLTNKNDGLEGTGDLTPEFAKQSSDVQAVVNLFGPVDLLIGDWQKSTTPVLVELLGGTIKEKTDLAKKASPINYVEKSRTIPPIITFHGTKDPLVPYIHATKLQSALDKVDAHAKLVTMEGEGHGWLGEKLDKTLQQSIEFFDENLKGKK
ncbi:MAG: alpha/beta hydrolase [Gemmatales bacterium]